MKKCCNRLRLRAGVGVDENLLTPTPTPTPVKTTDSGRLRLRLRLRSPGVDIVPVVLAKLRTLNQAGMYDVLASEAQSEVYFVNFTFVWYIPPRFCRTLPVSSG